MKEKRIECVKKEIRSVLIPFKNGLSLSDFLKTYRGLIGTPLPSREFGYTSNVDFLHSIPDVVHLQTDRNGIFQLYVIADETTTHIQKLVGKQRVVKPRSNNKSRNFSSTLNNSIRIENGTSRCRPFVPALLRAEIIQVVKQYPEGIGHSAIFIAYRSMFNKALNLAWLSSEPKERLQKLANAVPELELKIVDNQEKLQVTNQHCTVSNGTNTSRLSHMPQTLKVVEKTSLNKPASLQFQLLDASAISDSLKQNFEKVLMQYPEGILAVHFPVLYEKMTNQCLDLHELGYNSLIDLVDALPTIFFRAPAYESSKDWILLHVDFSKNAPPSSSIKPKPVLSNSEFSEKYSYRSKGNIPNDVAPTDLQYVRMLPPEEGSDKFFPLFVSAVINPSLFWFQLQTKEAISNLIKLEKEMQFFYNSQSYKRYQMADADILVGSSCVAFCRTDNHWYRAVITSLPSVDCANVLFVDYGSWEKIPRSLLHYLRYNFLHLPAHAIKARLAAIKPSNETCSWTTKAKTRFLQLCNHVSLMAQISLLHENAASIFMCDSSGEEDIHLNDVLVNEGYAEYCGECDFDNCYSSPVGSDYKISRNNPKASSPSQVNGYSDLRGTPNGHHTSETPIPSQNGGESSVLRGMQNGSHSSEIPVSFLLHRNENMKPSFKPRKLFGNDVETQSLPKEVDTQNVQRAVDTQSMPEKIDIQTWLKKVDTQSLQKTLDTQNPLKKKSVKKILLGNDYKIHIILVGNEAYVSGDDLSNLLWSGKTENLLAGRLRFKELTVPTLSISKEDYRNLFDECERHSVKGFLQNNADYSVVLYPLNCALKILNTFGHPSETVREGLCKEIENPSSFDQDLLEGESNSEIYVNGDEDNISRLCLYDLRAMLEALRYKRLKLMSSLKENKSESNLDDLKKLEFRLDSVIKRMQEIDAICLKYSRHTL